MESKRDAEIARLKKKILKAYQQQQLSTVLPVYAASNNKRRASIKYDAPPSTPRKKFRSASTDLWRNECQSTSNIYDTSLPTLEEAAHLFGYASAAATN
jgi:hypothetical protein